MWSFVGNKVNKQWVWIAIEQLTGEIIGIYVGSRDENSAECSWVSLHAIYRQCALAYTDFWTADTLVIPPFCW